MASGAACALSGNVFVPGKVPVFSGAPPLLSSGSPWAAGWVRTESAWTRPPPS